MTLQEAIEARHSVRKYIDKPIPQDIIDILQAKIEECNDLGNLHIQLVTNEPKAFKGKMAYGTFSGVSNYFVMVGKKADDLSERVGYYGEQLVLLAQTLGLNTCWVGLTYNNIKEAYEKGNDEKLCCMIALGYGDDPGRNFICGVDQFYGRSCRRRHYFRYFYPCIRLHDLHVLLGNGGT